ncbi:MAG: RelA/SpoT family protein [Albidovulum sp.]|nr:RelA/SpoT family protein [Albidovulum sp.]MDE0531923.1 RelA/SpoT family protein [Albidovulum sp.]
MRSQATNWELPSGVDELVADIREYNPNTNQFLIRKAYRYGEDWHRNQFRRSGEPYFIHPLAVARILLELKMDDQTIVTGLLHDTMEDTAANYSKLAQEFGEKIAEYVDGVTKLTKFEFPDTETLEAENVRKLLLATSESPCVLFVKLADRLHNMRTIEFLPPEKQRKKAVETMEFYAPLAGRMGMQNLREELEDLAFQVLDPRQRDSIRFHHAALERQSAEAVKTITRDMEASLKDIGIVFKIQSRAKKPFSIWRKANEKDIPFSTIADAYGFRIITETQQEAYQALGVIHMKWNAIPGRFKDYISQPKVNGYRSIHTTVLGPSDQKIEVQIRTLKMHQVAELGLAAHWSYKDGVRVENPYAEDSLNSLSELKGSILEFERSDKFLDHLKLEMNSNRVFCFTPKGKVVKLVQGATVLDFAYAIHTNIGHGFVAAKVDGRSAQAQDTLENGNTVEIVSSEHLRPNSEWENFVKSARAKSAIRRYVREKEEEKIVEQGKFYLKSQLEKAGYSWNANLIETAVDNMNFSSEKELLAQIGSRKISTEDLLMAVYPEYFKDLDDETVPAENAVTGLRKGHSYRRADCCNPVPGEKIVGINQRGKVVSIHAIYCPKLKELEQRRWESPSWNAGRHAPIYPVTLEITMANRAGVLGRICTSIGEQNSNISNLKIVDKQQDFYRLEVDVDVRGIGHLHSLQSSIKADSDVRKIERLPKESNSL